jgi:hypothetical protein
MILWGKKLLNVSFRVIMELYLPMEVQAVERLIQCLDMMTELFQW